MSDSLLTNTNTSLPPKLGCDEGTRKWHVFLLSGGFSFLTFLALVLFGKLTIYLYKWCPKKTRLNQKVSDGGDKIATNTIRKEEPSDWTSCYRGLEDWAGRVLSGQTISGRILVVLVFMLSLASLTIYFIDTELLEIEECIDLAESWTLQIDLAINICFLLHFLLRFVAAQDKLKFSLEIYSWIDYFTIVPSFVSVYLNRSWLGLRFLRVLHLLTIPDILQYLNLLRTNNHLRLVYFLTLFISFWFASAGLIHLVENTGDPWLLDNSQKLSYWECVYFILVTASTVGYGDISAGTAMGRLLMVFIIMGGLVIFANAVPEIFEYLTSGNKYSGRYKMEKGKKHIVVCGHITYSSVSNFLSDFFHKDREDNKVDVVFLDKKFPDLELEGLLKRYFTQAEYFMGSVLNINDLERVAVQKAEACFILANKYCRDPDCEDAENTMRVISVKNFHPNIKVIIQLMQYHNKNYLLKLPSWNWKLGDDVVCLAELKLGFMAQNCLAPGFSTLLANLFTMRSCKQSNTYGWQDDYLLGTGMEMYVETFSLAFKNLTFSQAVQLCYIKLRLLLIAIDINDDDDGFQKTIAVNPGSDVKINAGGQGFFIAQSEEEAKRARNYCLACHSDIQDPIQIIRCKCKGVANHESNESNNFSRLKSQSTMNGRQTNAMSEKHMSHSEGLIQELDSSGMFHWCPSRDFHQSFLDTSTSSLTDHIIVCLLCEDNSPLIGLSSFIMPLRASNYEYSELKDIVILGDPNYLEREWPAISNFPKVYMKPGSPLIRSNLRAVSISTCDMCVILSAHQQLNHEDDLSLVDTASILCSLNIKSEVGSTSMPMITELVYDSNVQFLDQEDEDDPKAELYLTQPFARGTAFAASVLDSLMSTSYFNENALTLIRLVVTGGLTPAMDQVLAENEGIQGGYDGAEANKLAKNRNRCKVEQLSVLDTRFKEFSIVENGTYGVLFLSGLQTSNILCIGLYRLIDQSAVPLVKDGKRYVITNPSSNFHLLQTDKVFCFVPCNAGYQTGDKGEVKSSMAAELEQNTQQSEEI